MDLTIQIRKDDKQKRQNDHNVRALEMTQN